MSRNLLYSRGISESNMAIITIALLTSRGNNEKKITPASLVKYKSF